MAFQLQRELANGVIINLHAIDKVSIDYLRLTTHAQIKSYVEKEFAEKIEEQSIEAFDYTFDGLPVGDPLTFSYDQLRLRPEWTGAVDVPEPIKKP